MTNIEIRMNDGKTVTTTLKGLEMATKKAKEEKAVHITEKVTGKMREGYSIPMPEVGEVKDVKLTVEVDAITRKHDKDGNDEFVIVWKVVE